MILQNVMVLNVRYNLIVLSSSVDMRRKVKVRPCC